ncbi:MAG TPA: GAF domain-containing protein, partial [bacterium]|nr:GAF domain-containing protein [bacterium]
VQSNPRIRSSIVCPLICQEELLGVLSLNRTTKRENFTVADLLSVSIFAAQAAQAIHNSSIYRALELKITQLEESNKRIRDLEQGLGS